MTLTIFFPSELASILKNGIPILKKKIIIEIYK